MEGAPKKDNPFEKKQKQMNRRAFLGAIGATGAAMTVEGLTIGKKKDEPAKTEKPPENKKEQKVAQNVPVSEKKPDAPTN